MSSYAKFSQYTGNIPIRPPLLVSVKSFPISVLQYTKGGYQTLKTGYPNFPNTCGKLTRPLVSHYTK